MDLLLANPLYTALMGERRGRDRNGAWRAFPGSGGRVRHTTSRRGHWRRGRSPTCATPPGTRPTGGCRGWSPSCARTVTGSPGCGTRADGQHEAARKTIDHPPVGALTLDCDVLSVSGSDLRIMIYTAEPGSGDEERLALLAVLGTQTLVG